jgi:hypothetical protein
MVLSEGPPREVAAASALFVAAFVPTGALHIRRGFADLAVWTATDDSRLRGPTRKLFRRYARAVSEWPSSLLVCAKGHGGSRLNE